MRQKVRRSCTVPVFMTLSPRYAVTSYTHCLVPEISWTSCLDFRAKFSDISRLWGPYVNASKVEKELHSPARYDITGSNLFLGVAPWAIDGYWILPAVAEKATTTAFTQPSDFWICRIFGKGRPILMSFGLKSMPCQTLSTRFFGLWETLRVLYCDVFGENFCYRCYT